MFNAASSTRQFVRHSFSHVVHFPAHLFQTPLAEFMIWLTAHQNSAYSILFLGAYFETLVGPGFFIPGELFFLAGSILAGAGILNIWIVIPVLYIGAACGDSSSYFIGRALGSSIFKEERKILSRKNYRKVEQVFEKYGPRAIFFARLIGPFPILAPVLAGIYGFSYKTFLTYNIPGILVGVGEFIIVGYFFGSQYELVLWLIERYVLLLIIVIVLVLFTRWYFKRRGKLAEDSADDSTPEDSGQ